VVGEKYAEIGGGRVNGAAYIFQRNQGGANNWGEAKGFLTADSYEWFGASVRFLTLEL
jgi:hypothetical protein